MYYEGGSDAFSRIDNNAKLQLASAVSMESLMYRADLSLCGLQDASTVKHAVMIEVNRASSSICICFLAQWYY